MPFRVATAGGDEVHAPHLEGRSMAVQSGLQGMDLLAGESRQPWVEVNEALRLEGVDKESEATRGWGDDGLGLWALRELDVSGALGGAEHMHHGDGGITVLEAGQGTSQSLDQALAI